MVVDQVFGDLSRLGCLRSASSTLRTQRSGGSIRTVSLARQFSFKVEVSKVFEEPEDLRLGQYIREYSKVNTELAKAIKV